MNEVELFDGTVLEFPDGTSQDVMDRAAREETARIKMESGGQRVVATTTDGGRFVQGSDGAVSFVSPGYSTSDPAIVKRLMDGDNVKSVVQSGFDQQTIAQHPIAARVQEFNRGTPFIGSYLDEAVGRVAPESAQGMRDLSSAMQRENPGQTAALNIGGGLAYTAPFAVAGAGAAGTKTGQAARALIPSSTGGRIAAGSLLGATAGGTEGAIYGYGEGNTSAERLGNLGRQAKVGATFGGLLGAGAPLVGDLIGSIAQRWKSRDVDMIAAKFNVSIDTARVLKKAFQNNDLGAVDRILRAGSEATMADAGRSGQALLDAAAQTGGRPLNIVDQAVGARAERSLGTVTDALDEALGPVMGPRAAARNLARTTGPERSARYNAAYGTPIDYATPGGAGDRILSVLSGIDDKTIKEAVDIANAKIQWKVSQGQLPPNFGRQMLLEVGEDGTLRFKGDLPNVAQLDELKKALQQIDQSSRDMFGRAADGGFRGEQATAVRDATVEATGGKTGTYQAALNVGQGKIEQDNALKLGLNMLRDTNTTTREFVSEALSGMSADGRQMMKTGVRSYIDELMGKVKIIASDPENKAAREAMAALKALSSGNARAKLEMLLGPDDFAKLSRQMDEAIMSQSMAASVSQNSRTAIRQSIQGEVQDITRPGALGQLLRGEPVSATKELTQALLATTPGDDAARMEKVWSEIAQVLSERRGSKSAAAALKYVEKALAGQPLKEAEAKLIAQQVMIGVPVAGGRGANQYLVLQ